MRTKTSLDYYCSQSSPMSRYQRTGWLQKSKWTFETIGARNINAGQMNFYSVEREIALGRELAEELGEQQPDCRRS